MKYRDMVTPATQRERSDDTQVQNSAGGFVYEVDKATRLRRFLVLGAEGGTFYASERDLTKANLDFLKAFARDEPAHFHSVLFDANKDNIAPRHSTLLLALAVLVTQTDDQEVRDAVKAQFTEFVRTGTHLFEFVDYALIFREWGRGLRALVSAWYNGMPADNLAYQVVKYRERGGWKHQDLVRKAHPKAKDEDTNAVLNYVAYGPITIEKALADGKPTTVNVDRFDIIDEFEDVKTGNTKPLASTLLSWEMLPTESLRDPDVWRMLAAKPRRLPYTAMLRNLGRMTSLGVFDHEPTLLSVTQRLTSAAALDAGRVHPFNVLTALKTYQSGGGFRGSLTWTPKRQIVDALNQAFYSAFATLDPTLKRINVALDVSGSMSVALMNSNVTAREGAMAMAMATMAADPLTTTVTAFTSMDDSWKVPNMRQRFYGYPSGISETDVSSNRRLDDNLTSIRKLRMGGTDCALPMLWAMETKREFDAFVIYTDNETWAGDVQPMDALAMYRKSSGIDARLIVVGMTSTGFTIADPRDGGALDVTGFDASAPRVIADFVAGKF